MRPFRLPLVQAAILALAFSLGARVAGQSEAPAEPAGAAFWIGTWSYTGGEEGVGTAQPGYTELLGGIVRGAVAADDPRMVGTWTQVNNVHLAPGAAVGQVAVGISSGRVRIDNDEGSWVGTMTGYGGPLVGPQEWYVLEGEGAYDGLTTVFRYGSNNVLEGVIMPSSLPALPESIAPPAE